MDELKEIREALEWIERYGAIYLANETVQMCASEAESALEALSRLEAREAEAPKDTKALAEKLNYLSKPHIGVWGPDHEKEAAVEIERYAQARIGGREEQIQLMGDRIRYLEQAFSRLSEAQKTVPMAMLADICNSAFSTRLDIRQEKIDIAARFGYTVTED